MRWQWSVLVALCVAGCASPFSQGREVPLPQEQTAHAIRDREADMATARAELAAARIAMAKQDAEVHELRAMIQQLRQDHAEAQQALMVFRREADEKRERTNTVQIEKEKDEQVKQAQQLAVLHGTVTTLRERLDLLTQELAHAAVPADRKSADAHPSRPRDPEVRESSEAAPRMLPSVLGNVPTASASGAAAIRPISNEEVPATKHTVQPGDTLWKIARRHNTTVERLRQVNRLDRDGVTAGTVLVVPPAR